jgi:predicted amidohydrolase YtcJ
MTIVTTRLITNARIFTSREDDAELHQAMVVRRDEVAFVGTEKAARDKLRKVR